MIATKAVVNSSNALLSRTWTGILALALAWAWGCPPNARAVDYWVAPKGRDAIGQGNRTRPWASLQFAADRVRPGDTVHVRDGDYQGFDLRQGGTKDAAVCFKAEGKHVRIVRRKRNSRWNQRRRRSYVVIEGFIVNDMPRHRRPRGRRFQPDNPWHPRRSQRRLGILIGFCDDVVVINTKLPTR